MFPQAEDIIEKIRNGKNKKFISRLEDVKSKFKK